MMNPPQPPTRYRWVDIEGTGQNGHYFFYPDLKPEVKVTRTGAYQDLSYVYRLVTKGQVSKRVVLWRMRKTFGMVVGMVKKREWAELREYLAGYRAIQTNPPPLFPKEGRGITKRRAIKDLQKGRRRMRG